MAAFKDAKIPVAEIFGKIAGSAPLEEYALIINEEMDLLHVLPILKVVSKFPFTKFAFWPPIYDIGETEDVYIGNYGSQQTHIPLTEDVRQAITEAVHPADLDYIIKTSRVATPQKRRRKTLVSN